MCRLHRFSLTPDATFLVWKKESLLCAPLYSGVVQVRLDTVMLWLPGAVQVFNTAEYEEKSSLVGFFRKIDALATFENLAATAETRTVR